MPLQDGSQKHQLSVGGFVNLKQLGMGLGLIFAITLAVVVGKQMSAEAMAVVVGIVCGVAAAIPTSVLLLVVLTRRDRRRVEELQQQARQGNYPPVVVIQGGTPQALPTGPQAGYWPAVSPGPPVHRQFHVVGEDLLLDERQA
jgi:hypothetical protein